MSIKKVVIEPGCITCGLCEMIAPEVFTVTDISHVRENVPYDKYEEEIKQSAVLCPVQVITYQEE